jgi:ATP-dependent exoDNAse (exonuclease V) beta subunit
MNERTEIKDQAKRLAALSPDDSFIVQAPAGSGKTELLTQRFLVLLALANVPEEVVAITFTRKAVAEMKARILTALQAALSLEPPSKQHALQTWQLAKKVLARDKQKQWNLLQNPNRLRIFTIDALCARISKSAPVISRFGSIPKIAENADFIYQEAARRLIACLDQDHAWVKNLENLLAHLDNNLGRAEALFIGMLRHRDQWLTNVVQHRTVENSRKILEASLKNVIENSLTETRKIFPRGMQEELLTLIRFAGSRLLANGSTANLVDCANLITFPESKLELLNAWQGIADLLLTKSYDWRLTVNRNCGFPAASEAINSEEKNVLTSMKRRMVDFLQSLQGNDGLRLALKEVLLLPPPRYSDKQWAIVHDMLELLPILVAHLSLIFQEQNVIDFIAIAEGAINALGDSDNPSELALNLDYQIQHLLVDEFQDTSLTQYRLIELLVAGWEKNDGRTLFLVGDPMQSIYRFREADVGIYLKVKQYGIGQIRLKPLTLEVNFRSHAPIVNWFNDHLKPIFPSKENIQLGAIPFSESTAFLSEENSSRVVFHSFINPVYSQLSNSVVETIKTELATEEQTSIAILVRSRSHLQTIMPELKKANISFQAVEIEQLVFSEAVLDLLALTKALSHPADRIAWLAILRAPWCGLSLNDLYFLVNHNLQKNIFEILTKVDEVKNLSEEGRQRIARIVPILVQAMNERARTNLRQFITYIWYALGGPACLTQLHELKNVEAYLSLLEHFSDPAQIDFNLLEQKLAGSYSKITTANARVQLMTIHKAKGLEFDVVIIPFLDKKPAVDESRLLVWLEQQNYRGETDLIFAPIRSAEDDFDPIYRYIRNQHTLRENYEVARLLYVAVTRAKKRLHLVGSINRSDNQLQTPQQGSFLSLLWPFWQNADHQQPLVQEGQQENISPSRTLKRLSLDWKPSPYPLPQVGEGILNLVAPPQAGILNLAASHKLDGLTQYQHHVGTVIHEQLKLLSELNLAEYQVDLGEKQILIWQKKLRQLGVLSENIPTCIQLIKTAIVRTLQDSRGRWVLDQAHHAARSELAMSAYLEDTMMHYVIDRTFIDDGGNRWIIDYKTSVNDEESEAQFLARMRDLYSKQLTHYARVFTLLEDRPIKLGLYFPLFSGWCEWSYIEESKCQKIFQEN